MIKQPVIPENKELPIVISILLFLTIPAIGLVDYWSGPDFTFALIYLFPVSVIAWLANGRAATSIASIVTVITWTFVDYYSSRYSIHIPSYAWNFLSRLIIFFLFSNMLSALKRSMLTTKHLSIRDPLTNALNNRGFLELAEREVYRSKRSGKALSIVFLDVDNFKLINDTYGHNAGDKLLISIVEFLHMHTRQGDLIGRIGGDEFILLFPDADQDMARMIVNKIRGVFTNDSEKMLYPVTFSMGVLTCLEPPPSVEDMIGMADKLMYKVKTGSKNGVIFFQYPE